MEVGAKIFDTYGNRVFTQPQAWLSNSVVAAESYLWKLEGTLTSTGSGDRAGLFVKTAWDGGNTSSFHGILSQVSATTDTTWIAAITPYARLASQVTVTNLVALEVAGHVPIAGATATNLYGVHVSLGYVGDLGTVGTVIGGFFQTPAMPATTKYALYSEGNNVFKGQTAFASASVDTTIAVSIFEEFSVGSTYGLQVKAADSGGSSVAIYGIEEGLGSGSNNVGVWGRGVKRGSTTLTEFVGVRGSVTHSSGAVTNAISVHGLAPTGSGITNAWSGYFETPTAGSSTNWALRSDGPTYLEGATTFYSGANKTALTTSGHSVTGSGTTPLFNLAGTWNTSGAPSALVLDITDTASATASLLLDLKKDGSSVFRIRKDGAIVGGLTVTGNVVFYNINADYITLGNIYALGWSGRSKILSPADGQLLFTTTAETDFARAMFGGTTSSYPALKRSSAALHVRLADDSGYAALDASAYSAGGTAGVTETRTVRNATGDGTATLIFTGGLYTGGTG